MLKNYLKITFRSLIKNKWYTSINVLGLALGVATALVIALIIRYELSFDRHHPKKDKIYRVVRHHTNASGASQKPNVPYIMAEALRSGLPDIAEGIAGLHYHEQLQMEVNGEKSFVENIVFSEPQLFNIFDIGVKSGNPSVDLLDPGKVFISPSLAIQLFGDENKALGKTIKIRNRMDLSVAGILQPQDDNTHLSMNMIVSYASFDSSYIGGFPIDQWGVHISGYSYLYIPSQTLKNAAERVLKSVGDTHYDQEGEMSTSFHLQPLLDIHFDETYSNDTFPTIDKSYIWILLSIGIFVLTIACVNFINMSTAQATQRAKEVGLRKTLGARKRELVSQFLGESFAIALVALVLALVIAELVIPFINHFMDKSIVMHLFTDPFIILVIVSLLAFVTVTAGLYPSLILSNYNPVHALKININTTKRSGISLRKALVAFQFVITQVLIIATIVISAQTDYFFNKPLGFDKDLIISIDLPERDSLKNQALKQAFLNTSTVKYVSLAVGAPTSENNLNVAFAVDDHADDMQYDISLKTADKDYLNTYGIELVAGRWFGESDNIGTHDGVHIREALVVNETAVSTMGYDTDEVLGKHITLGLNSISAPVVGVVKDFHSRSFHKKITPLVIAEVPQLYYHAGIKLSSSNFQHSLGDLKLAWESVYPDHILEYEFLDDQIAENYQSEERMFILFKIFAGISIFICCIGLFGLISFVVTKKTKEVGIRKTLGASVNSIVLLFVNDFVKIIIVAFLIASPFIWYFLNNWLDTFAYRIDLNVGFFIVGLLLTVLITLASIGYQSIKAAIVNPVDSLKDE